MCQAPQCPADQRPQKSDGQNRFYCIFCEVSFCRRCVEKFSQECYFGGQSTAFAGMAPASLVKVV